MIVGACAGSTGGGMKVSRILILLKSIKQEVKKASTASESQSVL